MLDILNRTTSFSRHSPQVSLFGWDGDKNVRYLTVSKARTYSTGGTLTASNYNDDRDEIIAGVNSITNAQVAADAAIDASKLSGVATLTGTETFTNKTLTSPKISSGLNDTSGNELLRTTATSSAINDITIANAGAGNAPSLTATGDDTNIHLALTGKGNGLVKLSTLRQDLTSNTYATNQVILTGWSYIAGDSSSTSLTKAITFGVTFSTAPVVIVSKLASKLGGAPTVIGDLTTAGSGNDQNHIVGGASITTTGFIAYVGLTNNSTLTGYNYGFSWIAIGTL